MTTKESFLYSILTTTFLIFLSLLSSWVLFNYLESSAFVENEKVVLGGAIAGFIVIFYSLNKFFYKLLYSGIDLTNKSNENKIKILENKVNELLFENFNKEEVPKDFIRYIDLYNKITFCYPDYFEISVYDLSIILLGMNGLKIHFNRELEQSSLCVSSIYISRLDFIDSSSYKELLECINVCSETNPYFDGVTDLELIHSIKLEKNGKDVKDLTFKGIDKNGYSVKIISKTIRISNDKICSIVFQCPIDLFDYMYSDFEKMFQTFNFVYIEKDNIQS